MKKQLKLHQDILFFAFRYALGRMSYAPSTVMEAIEKNIEELSTNDIQQYIKEIDECNDYGMEIDKKDWLKFKQFLENELMKRK